MITVPLKIQDKSDAEKPLFPEFRDSMPADDECRATLVGVGLLQGGMKSGKPSVALMIRITTTDVSMVVCAETSAAMFLTLAAGMKGAMERWGEPWDGA